MHLKNTIIFLILQNIEIIMIIILPLFIMNSQFYMTNESIILIKNENVFSPVSVLNYSFYQNKKTVFE